MGAKLDVRNAAKKCIGSIDEVSKIDGESQYLKLRGWVFDPLQNKVPEYALLIDEVDTVYGVVLTGGDRKDVADAINSNARYSGAKGYLWSDTDVRALKIFVPDSACLVDVVLK